MSAVRHRVIVKCGTRLLTGPDGIDEAFVRRIAGQIAGLMRSGVEVAYVTSGAVGAGRARLRLAGDSLATRQVLAAVGQAPLMAIYAEAFADQGVVIAQALLSRADLGSRRGYLNTRNALIGALNVGVLPIANENDVVATEELTFGDNDVLSMLVAALIGADQLILLTTTDGLYTSDPQMDPDAELIREAGDVPPETLAGMAGEPGAEGLGGMRSKLEAARDAAAIGIDVVIANGTLDDVVPRIVRGEKLGTHFAPSGPIRSSRDRWLGSALAQRGTVQVDAGARAAVVDGGRSLLPVGVRDVRGVFERGDLVGLVGPDGLVFARGLVNYDQRDLGRISGQPSRAIRGILGYDNGAEAVHRNNLVVVEPALRQRSRKAK